MRNLNIYFIILLEILNTYFDQLRYQLIPELL